MKTLAVATQLSLPPLHRPFTVGQHNHQPHQPLLARPQPSPSLAATYNYHKTPKTRHIAQLNHYRSATFTTDQHHHQTSHPPPIIARPNPTDDHRNKQPTQPPKVHDSTTSVTINSIAPPSTAPISKLHSSSSSNPNQH